MTNFRIVYIGPTYQSLDKRIWFTILFFFISKSCTLFQILIFFAKLWLILTQFKLWRRELPKCAPSVLLENCDHTICPDLSILFIWLFEKLIFELEASYSFEITCNLVRQVISLKKNGGVISKIFLVSWSPICTLLILVWALVKMTSTSATVIYNSMRTDNPVDLLI